MIQRAQIIFASGSVAQLFLSRSSVFVKSIIFDYVIRMAAKKRRSRLEAPMERTETDKRLLGIACKVLKITHKTNNGVNGRLGHLRASWPELKYHQRIPLSS
jgi:hypothetical protein